jgi:hypothetical protein
MQRTKRRDCHWVAVGVLSTDGDIVNTCGSACHAGMSAPQPGCLIGWRAEKAIMAEYSTARRAH